MKKKKVAGDVVKAMAAKILQQHAPDVPPPPTPGDAALVVLLHNAGARGDDLDWRSHRHRWDVLAEGSSLIPQDYVTVHADGKEVVLYLADFMSRAYAQFEEIPERLQPLVSIPAPPAPPKGFAQRLHDKLCKAARSFRSEGFDNQRLRTACGENNDPDTITRWLRAMKKTGWIISDENATRPTYHIARNDETE